MMLDPRARTAAGDARAAAPGRRATATGAAGHGRVSPRPRLLGVEIDRGGLNAASVYGDAGRGAGGATGG